MLIRPQRGFRAYGGIVRDCEDHPDIPKSETTAGDSERKDGTGKTELDNCGHECRGVQGAASVRRNGEQGVLS